MFSYCLKCRKTTESKNTNVVSKKSKNNAFIKMLIQLQLELQLNMINKYLKKDTYLKKKQKIILIMEYQKKKIC